MEKDPTSNYICPETVGVHCLNFGVVYNSPSRSQMMGSHLTSKLVIEEPEPARIQSGGEHEFGKYTTCVKMPANGRIIDVVERYPRGVGEGTIGHNPETVVIFQNDETHQLDYFTIPYYTSFHQYFGYKNRLKMENLNQLVPGNFVRKGTVFAHSPGLGPYNNYMYGRNLNLALMSWPGTAEDGIVISRDALSKFRFHIYETRSIGFGSTSYPLLVYGDKPFPEIGENVRDDGLLMAFRTYDEDLAPVEMGIHDMKNISHTFDKALYAREAQSDVSKLLADGTTLSKPGRVIDIEVIKNNENQRNLPPRLAEYFEKYARANKKFYQRILKTIGDLSLEQKKKYKDGKLNLAEALHNLLVEARGVTNSPHQDARVPLTLMVNQNPVDEYLITFVVEYEITPNIGYKLTAKNGDNDPV